MARQNETKTTGNEMLTRPNSSDDTLRHSPANQNNNDAVRANRREMTQLADMTARQVTGAQCDDATRQQASLSPNDKRNKLKTTAHKQERERRSISDVQRRIIAVPVMLREHPPEAMHSVHAQKPNHWYRNPSGPIYLQSTAGWRRISTQANQSGSPQDQDLSTLGGVLKTIQS